MTEGNDDGSNLVRVRAQVMMRDDSTGGWVPMGGGGLSNVSVRKRILPTDVDDVKPEYFIYGKRISDQTVVLSCTIKKDFQYNKVMPTFHHWVTGDHKFGLTFQTAADARAFDKGVRLAVDDILEGFHDIPLHRFGRYRHLDVGDDEVFMAVNLPVERDGSRSSSGSVTTSSSGSRHTPVTTPLPTPDHPTHHGVPITANTPLTTPDLPLHHFHQHHHLHHHHHHHHHMTHGGVSGGGGGAITTNPSPASTVSNPVTTISTPAPPNHHHHLHLHRMTYHPRHKPAPLPADKNLGDLGEKDPDKIQVLGDSYSYSYVQFAKSQAPIPPNHEYSYPMVEGFHKGSDRRDSIASLKKHHQQLEVVGGTPTQPLAPAPPLLPGGKRGGRKRDRRNRKASKARCRFCHDAFSEEVNPRGSCEFAPDYVRSAIDTLTCISCAQCMLYHCMSDAEGEFPHHPCECGGPTGGESCGRRWLGLTLLSLLVPCLWCYAPLRACHRCAVACGLCGGKHEAS